MQQLIAQIRRSSGEVYRLTFGTELWSSKQHVVFEGVLEQHAIPIVIKIPLSDEITTVHKEASILHRLYGIEGIPTYVGLYPLEDAGEYTGRQALLVEKVTGKDVEQRRKALAGKRPEWSDVRDILQQAAHTLAGIHDRGVAHCDIKLRNLMQNDDGHITILDWDNSVDFLHSSGKKEGTIVGTVQYMSLEQVTGKQLDGRTDIYSLGSALALYAYGPAVSQRYIIAEDGVVTERTSSETAEAIAGGEHIKYEEFSAPLSTVEAEFQSILRKMTQLELTLRYQSMHEVLRDLKKTIDTVAA